MKKSFKFLFSSVLLFSVLISCAAYAGWDPEIPGNAAFSKTVQYSYGEDPVNPGTYVLTPVADPSDEAALLYTDASGSEVKAADITAIEDLEGLSLTLTPPSGKIIRGIVFFTGTEYVSSSSDLNLTSICTAAPDSAELRLDLSALVPDAFAKDKDDKYYDSYSLAVILESVPAAVDYEYVFGSTDYKPEDFSLEEPYSGTYTDAFSLAEIRNEADENYIRAGYRFKGWEITYSNGSSLLLAPDAVSSFKPVISFKASPVPDKDIVVIILKNRTVNFSGALPSGATFELPDDGSMDSTDDYSASCISGKYKTLELETSLSALVPADDYFSADIILKRIKLSAEGSPEEYTEMPEFVYVFPGKLTLIKAPVTITAKSASKVYDGTALTCPELESVTGLMGENVLAASTPSVTGSRVDVGDSQNSVTGAQILSDSNASALDFTQYYSITYVNGTLSITKPEPVSIILTPSPDEIEKTYRGAGITPDSSGSPFYVMTGTLYPTDTVTVYSSLNASPVYENGRYEYTVAGYEVQRNNLPLSNPEDYYNIVVDNTVPGILEVKKYSITVTADSLSKPYDGKAISKNSYSQTGELFDGDKLSVSIGPEAELIKVGKTRNLITSCIITDASGNDVSSFYSLANNPGELEITRRPLTITVNSVSKEYNGKSQTVSTADGISLSSPLPNSNDSKYRYEMSLETSGSIKNIGSKDISLKVNKIFLYDSVQKTEVDNVTDQFDITIVPGKLTVTPRTLTVKTRSVSMAYTGQPLTDSATPEISGKLTGDKITLKFTGIQTNIGSTSNSCTVTQIVDANGKDVLKNYNIVYNFGKLTVYSSKAPNGAPLTGDPNRPELFICMSLFAVAGIFAAGVVYFKKRCRH